jgi:regulator of protease activity HflC (stomatin/prohibitin superfamily)
MRVVIRQFEAGLVYRDGVLEKRLGPGRHRLRRRRREVLRFDLRPEALLVANQEILTADGLAPKTTLAGQVRLVDPQRSLEASQDAAGQLYTAVQIALRARVAARSLDEVLEARTVLGAEVQADVAEVAASLGREVVDLLVRDVIVPAELRYAAMRVLTAKQEGLAALERARGETAALRSLANAARLAQDVPALLQLRTLRAVETGGATVVLRQD